VPKSAKLKILFMKSTKRHGHRLGDYQNLIIPLINLVLYRYLAPPFLASVGAAGYVGYAFSQTKAVPSSSNVSFLHLLGVAGGFGVSFWITVVHGKTLE
jgi:hypothetical protein